MLDIVKKTYRGIKRRLSPTSIPIIQKVEENHILSGDVALVTGGDGGIGSAIAKAFINAGAKVIITGRNETKLKACCDSLGESSNYIVLDQLNIEAFGEKIVEASKKFGKISIFINSSGTHISRKDVNYLNVSEKEYDSIMDLNLKGAYFLSQEVAKYYLKNNIQNARMIFISSSRGSEPAWSPYGISKSGINSMTKGLAKELISKGIIVNAIAPGPTATSLIDYKQGNSIYTDDNSIRRLTMPEEIAECAKFLCSGAGSTIVGETIHMSGGRGVIDIR